MSAKVQRCKIEINFVFCRENKITIMQTRSQTRKLLLDPKNVMFEIPVPRAKAKAKAKPIKASTRVLPESIKNGPSTPINCALFLPKYMQKPLYDVDINFDEASEAWRSNKTSIGNGEYKYKNK